MAQKSYFTNEEALQYAKVLFNTIENNSDIAQKLSDYGFTSQEIEEGKHLYEQAELLYTKNKKAHSKEKAAYAEFKQVIKEVSKEYSSNRNKAKLVFKENETAKVLLGLNNKLKTSILPSLEDTIHFYTLLGERNELLNVIARMQIKSEDINREKDKAIRTKELYSNYLQLKNINEQATKNKNEAFKALQKWTRNLYAYAKYALADKKQFLQAFGITIR